MTNCPMPLEWHPAYAKHTNLLDWLEGRGAKTPVMYLPKFKRPTIGYFTGDSGPILDATIERITLTKHKAFGPAPYVGDPFVYVWAFATDELGRAIAGEAHIVHKPRQPWNV